MPLSESLGSVYEGVARAWSDRFAAATLSQPTGKRILCAYTSNVDRCILVTQDLVDEMIKRSGMTASQLNTDVQQQDTPVSKVEAPADVVRDLLWSVAHKGVKIPATNLAVLDWLNDLFGQFGNQDERLGGAPGSMIETLTKLCQEENAVIWTVFHSPKQASVYKPGIRFLTADEACTLGEVEARDYHQSCEDRLDDPDVRNYPLEYQPGVKITYGSNPAHQVSANDPDRFICTAPYLFYQPDGKVDAQRSEDVPTIERIFQFPGLGDQQRDECVRRVAEKYPYIILAGLQRAPKSTWATIERELDMLRGQVTIHLEISGLGNLEWLESLIPRYVCSIGINEDEMPQMCDVLLGRGQPYARPYGSIWDTYQDARALAVKLGLKRLYVHTHTADLILRRVPIDEADLLQEIEADLYAKWIVTQWLKGTMVSGHLPSVGPKQEGLEALITFIAQVVGLSGKMVLQWVDDTRALAEAGHFTVEDDYAVAVVPVAWFLGPLAQTLITTGAGDRASVASFVQSCFTQSSPHGQP